MPHKVDYLTVMPNNVLFVLSELEVFKLKI